MCTRLSYKIYLRIGLFFNLFFISCSIKHEAIEQRNSILFIGVDDMVPVLGCYANSTAHTPNIDRLASQGVVFTQAYCQVGLSNPSRASLMTGLRPDDIKVWTLKPHFRDEKPDVITIPQFYKENSYATHAVGKIYHDGAYHQDPKSWSTPPKYNITQNGRGHKYVLSENYLPNRLKAASTEFADVPDTAYIDGKVSQAAIEVLNELADSVFFLAIGFRRPHLPFTAPKKYWNFYDRNFLKKELRNSKRPKGAPDIAFHESNELRGYSDIGETKNIPIEKQLELLQGYYASVSYVDAQIGMLIAELKRIGRYNNTIIVLYSDNGFHLGDFGLWGKTTNYEASVRVPLIFTGKGIKKGVINQSIVELIDIYPTLIELTHKTSNPILDGTSLVPILQGEATEVKKYALSQIVRPYRDAISSLTPDIMGYSIRADKYRYIEWRSINNQSILEKELYRIGNDYKENENIAPDKVNEKIMNELSNVIDNIRK